MKTINLPDKEYIVTVKIHYNNTEIIRANAISYEYIKESIMYAQSKQTFDVKGQIFVSHMDRDAMYDLGLLKLPKLKDLSLEALAYKSKSNESFMCKISSIIIDIHADDVVRGPLNFTSNVEPRWYPLNIRV